MISCIWISDLNEFLVFDARTSERYLSSSEKGQIVTQTNNCDNTLPICFNPQYSRHIYKYTYTEIHEFHVWELQIEKNEKFIGFLASKVALTEKLPGTYTFTYRNNVCLLSLLYIYI